jgi:hypothetical protein
LRVGRSGALKKIEDDYEHAHGHNKGKVRLDVKKKDVAAALSNLINDQS